MIPAFGLTMRNVIFVAVGTTSGFILQLILIANFWRFPIPFSVLVGNPGWQILRYACLGIVIGATRFREVPEIKKQASAARPFTQIQAVFLLVYPAYNALFLSLHGYAQVASIVLLPAVKYCMARILARVSKRIPVARTLGLVTIELFDALYLFKCMQTAGTILSGIGLIVVDLIHNIHHIRSLHKRVEQVKQDLARAQAQTTYHDMIREAMGRVESRTQSRVDIQPLASNAVVPIAVLGAAASSHSTGLDKSVQELILECEHIVLVEFIECAVPLYYSLYMVILYHLPNAKFYPEIQHLDPARLSRTVHNIALYAILELVSLLYMHFLLLRRFNISALHLLANVLERDNVMLQAVFMQWMIFVLQFTVEHNGKL